MGIVFHIGEKGQIVVTLDGAEIAEKFTNPLVDFLNGFEGDAIRQRAEDFLRKTIERSGE